MAWIALDQDTFVRANNADLGASWDAGYSTYLAHKIVSNQVNTTTAVTNESDETYALTLPPNCWAEITLATWSAGANTNYAWVMLRAAAPATATWAQATVARNDGSFTSKLEYRVAGASTALTSENATTWAAGDVVRFELIDTTYRMYRNGTLLLSATDSTISGSGRAGFGIYCGTAGTDVGITPFRCGKIGSHFSSCGVGG